MTTKADFNAEEWQRVLQGPPMAALLVMAAERGGTLRESVSIARAYTEARQQAGDHPLLDEIVASAPQIDPSGLQQGGDPSTEAKNRLQVAVETLTAKTEPNEVEAYKDFVRRLAQTVAEAHKEGGVLGIGGKQVSEKEQAALDEIAAMLDSG